MKNFTTITLLFVLLATSFSCCKDDNNKPDKPNYGAEYFKCKVNGVELDTQSNFSCNGKYFNYYPEAYFENPPGRMTFYG